MNLVYETTDRIKILKKVSQILANHPPKKKMNCNCEICRRASEVGQVARYSPKVARILSKGEDMTITEYRYLLKKRLTKTEIARVTNIPLNNLELIRRR